MSKNPLFAFLILLSLPVISEGRPLSVRPAGVHPEQHKRQLEVARLFPEFGPSRRLLVSRFGKTAAPDTVRLLGLRIQFQLEVTDDPATTGNGRFDLEPDTSVTIDPPPHNKAYFEAHLKALDNYIRSMSYGKTRVKYAVFPDEPDSGCTLPFPKGHYHDESRSYWTTDEILDFCRDAIVYADSCGAPFDQYDAFVIFHAGSDWQNDILGDTPDDIPSAFIPYAAIRDSIPVMGGAAYVKDMFTVPETQSQDGLTSAINGVTAHEFGHQLGLPDFYSTTTGLPQVGVWSIMDIGGALGVFISETEIAYGILPSSMCAWSRYFLGWMDAEVPAGVDTFSVTAAEIQTPGTKCVKIPISSTEYFMVENRQVDIDNVPFPVVNQDSLTGVILGPVSYYDDCVNEGCPINHEYDSLLPGSGLLIWHVNEKTILDSLAADRVNAHEDNQGLRLVEADGTWDLGDYSSPDWLGGPYDPFYRDNNDSFGPNTIPDSRSLEGAVTHITINEIGRSRIVMNFSFERDWSLDGWPVTVDTSSTPTGSVMLDLASDEKEELAVVLSDGRVLAFTADGQPVAADPIYDAGAEIKTGPAVAEFGGEKYLVFADENSMLHLVGENGQPKKGWPAPLGDSRASTYPMACDLDYDWNDEILVCSRDGSLRVFDHSGTELPWSPRYVGGLFTASAVEGEEVLIAVSSASGKLDVLDSAGVSKPGFPMNLDALRGVLSNVLIADLDRDETLDVLVVGSNGRMECYGTDGQRNAGWPAEAPGPVVAEPALSDIDGDGFMEILLITEGSRVAVLRYNGVMQEEWPYDYGSMAYSALGALSYDADRSGVPDVLVFRRDGLVRAWDSDIEEPPGWPMIADRMPVDAFIADANSDTEPELFVVSSGGMVHALSPDISSESSGLSWPAVGGSFSRRWSIPAEDLPPLEPSSSLNLSGLYAYPNPCQEDEIFFRYTLSRECDVTIEVFDQEGQSIEEFPGSGSASDNVQSWDVTSIASGVYVAKVCCNCGDDEKNGFIRFAVIK